MSVNVRLCLDFHLFIIHEAIREHLAFRRSLRNQPSSSYIIDPYSRSPPKSSGKYEAELDTLAKLERQSVDVILWATRSHIGMFKVSPTYDASWSSYGSSTIGYTLTV